jgi:hypothetical protein
MKAAADLQADLLAEVADFPPARHSATWQERVRTYLRLRQALPPAEKKRLRTGDALLCGWCTGWGFCG